MTEVEYQVRIYELEREVAKLQNEIKRNSTINYGLRWMDVPEAFDSEYRIPILEEVKDKAIVNNDGKPTHILIEGDNYHALTCLNYTHKGKVDVIYIDPPYNTGSDGFVYKDKRILEKFPDGTPVPTDHPLRHSYWLSFMEKRLRLAKNLLSDKGVIFISIDDNEIANLKLLCDELFGERNFLGLISRATGTTTGQDTGSLGKACDYILVYSKQIGYEIGGIPLSDKDLERYDQTDDKGIYSILQLRRTGGEDRREDRPTMYFPITAPDGTEVYPMGPTGYESRWRVGPEKVREMREKNLLCFKKDKDGEWKVYYKFYAEGRTKRPSNLWTDIDGNKKAQIEIKGILQDSLFETPKPLQLITRILEISSHQDSTILDFFAGSGTTMHATMALNAEDGGHRQCILVQMQENSGICEKVTYERNKRVMCGYTNAKGQEVAALGGSLKYYRTNFVGEHCHQDATDRDRIALSQKAGNLLALAENTLEEVLSTNYYQIFKEKAGDISTNGNLFTCVYFSDDLDEFGDFVSQIEKLQEEYDYPHMTVYLFCWDSPANYKEEFNNLRGIALKAIPQPILDIYKRINN